MGQAKHKQIRHVELIANGACVYCNSREDQLTIEHLPPRIMFRKKHRPKGLEFACCTSCNQGTKIADLVAAWMGRTLPASPSHPDDLHDNEKLMGAVANNVPGFFEEVMNWRREQAAVRTSLMADPALSSFPLDEMGFFYVGGPIVNSHMDASS